MLKAKGVISTVESVMVLIIVFIIFLFFFEAWLYVYSQQVLNNVANYTVDYWSMNTVDSCSDVEGWLATNVVEPTLQGFNVDPANVTFTATYPTLCNCAGSTLTIHLTLNRNFFSHWGAITSDAYAIAIKQGDVGENC